MAGKKQTDATQNLPPDHPTVAEATRFDVTVKDGQIADYRVRLNISFKYESGD